MLQVIRMSRLRGIANTRHPTRIHMVPAPMLRELRRPPRRLLVAIRATPAVRQTMRTTILLILTLNKVPQRLHPHLIHMSQLPLLLIQHVHQSRRFPLLLIRVRSLPRMG